MGVAAPTLIVGLGWAPQRALIASHKIASHVPVVNTGLVAAVHRLLPLAGFSQMVQHNESLHGLWLIACTYINCHKIQNSVQDALSKLKKVPKIIQEAQCRQFKSLENAIDDIKTVGPGMDCKGNPRPNLYSGRRQLYLSLEGPITRTTDYEPGLQARRQDPWYSDGGPDNLAAKLLSLRQEPRHSDGGFWLQLRLGDMRGPAPDIPATELHPLRQDPWPSDGGLAPDPATLSCQA